MESPPPVEVPRSRTRVSPTKKWLTYITIAFFFLSGGIEYSVILPTCWDYMQSFHSERWLYGFTLSAMSISNLLVGPVMGGIYDFNRRAKPIVLVLFLFQIGGNFMYFAATSKYMILGSRFIVGVGISAGAVLFGELARVTSKKHRTGVFSGFMATRQIGLIIGPAFNLFLRICNFHLGPFYVDKLRAPALFMMVVYLLLAVMFLLFFFKLPTVREDDEETGEDKRSRSQTPVRSPIEATTGNSIVVEVYKNNDHFDFHSPSSPSSSETSSLLSPSHVGGATSILSDSNEEQTTFPRVYGSINSPEMEQSGEGNGRYVFVKFFHKIRSQLVNFASMSCELLKEEIIVLLATLLFAMMAQMTLETGVVPFVEQQFHWNEFQTSLFFCAAGVEIVIVFIITSILSKRMSDRWLIVIGLVMELLAYVWYMALVANGKNSSWMIEKFCIGTFLVLLGIPFFIVASSSLYSKMLPRRIQGFGQGVRRSVVSLASIFGPLWAGASMERVEDVKYYPFFGVPLFLMVVILILTILSFTKLKEPDYNKQQQTTTNNSDNKQQSTTNNNDNKQQQTTNNSDYKQQTIDSKQQQLSDKEIET